MILSDYLDLNFKMASPTLHAKTKAKINAVNGSPSLAPICCSSFVLLWMRVKYSLLQLYSLSFSPLCVKEVVTGKSPLLSRTLPQVRSAAVLHLVHPSISVTLAWFTFAAFYFDSLYFSLQHRFLAVTQHSCPVPFPFVLISM